MLQIIIFLGAIYLIFKGQELVQIAASSSHENRAHNMQSARSWNVAAWVLAAIFIMLAIAQGSSANSGLSGY